MSAHQKFEAREVLLALASGGYFEKLTWDSAAAVGPVAEQFQLGIYDLIDLVVDAGLATFSYIPPDVAPTMHPKDVLDYWQLFLSPAGTAILDTCGVSYSAECLAKPSREIT
jgi:hypothetical protein